MFFSRLFFLVFCFCHLSLNASETSSAKKWIIDLRNPLYEQGVISTQEGGIIQTEDLRLQARKITYVQRMEEGQKVCYVEAEEDLMLQYQGRAYVGKRLYYNFIEKTGVVYEGKSAFSIWFVGGERIELHPDGSYQIREAFITTSDLSNSSWDLYADSLTLFHKDLLEANQVRFRVFSIPTLWLPSFKVNLKKFKDPLLRYYAHWDSGQGPLAGFRYQLYSWEDLAFYGRLEYRLRTGWGGALESEYLHEKTRFATRNYVGTNRLQTAPDKQLRYRFQGSFHSQSENDQTQATLMWDRYNDVRMPSDFTTEDFEIETHKQTLFSLHHRMPKGLVHCLVRPRLNAFESIQQELPTVKIVLYPTNIAHSDLFTTTTLKASYLDFQYSDQLTHPMTDFASWRFDLQESLYRPFRIKALSLTPYLDARGLYYSQSPEKRAQKVGYLGYGLKAHLQGRRSYAHYHHLLKPYLHYRALSQTASSVQDHYVFSLQDGYHQIQQIQVGVQNSLFTKKAQSEREHFFAHFYANAFFADSTIPQVIPKLYLDLGWRLPSLSFTLHPCWNFRNHVLDFMNARLRWTLSEDCALSLEGRYRSRFDFRKADREDFILDVSRTEEDLLSSPLSDRRATLLTHLFLRINPFWELNIRSHHGFYRIQETPYNEFEMTLCTWLSSSWKLRLTASHYVQDAFRFGAGISLIK